MSSVSNLSHRRGRIAPVIALAGCITAALLSHCAWANRGDLDLAFGINGVVALQLQDKNGFLDVAVQADGKIVAAGFSGQVGNLLWAVARFNSDGSLDNTFGTGGTRLLPPPPGQPAATAVARGLAIDASGRIVLIGPAHLMRLTSAGDLDTSYGTAGIYTPPLNAGQSNLDINDITVADDGGFLLAASVNSYEPPNYLPPHATVIKLTADAVADATFGSNGISAIPANGNVRLYAEGRAVASWNGGIYVGGDQTARWFLTAGEVHRMSASGAIDSTFGNNGVLTPYGGQSNSPSHVWAMAAQPGLGVLAVGYYSAPISPCCATELVRFGADGQLDTDFIPMSIRSNNSSIGGLLVDAGNRVIVAATEASPMVVGLLPNGAADPDFGTNGRINVPFGSPVRAFAQQTDGKYLLAGSNALSPANATTMYLARLRGSAVIPPEISATPASGATLSSAAGTPGTTLTLANLSITNTGGDPLTIASCSASAGFNVTTPLPLSIATATTQSIAIACDAPSVAFTTRNGTLTCTGINDPDEPALSYALQCISGAGGGSPTSVPTLGRGALTLLALGLGLLGLMGFGQKKWASSLFGYGARR